MSWVPRRIGDVTTNFDAMRVPVRAADRRPGPYPYYGASGVIDWVDSYLLDGEFLLIAEDGENLRTRKTPIACVVRGKFWVNNHAHVMQGNGDADTRFLGYYLSRLDISGYLSGSTQPKLTQASLNRIEITLPPLREQRAIADLFGALDDKIELNRRMSDTLRELATGLFASRFHALPRLGTVADLLELSRESIDPQQFPSETFDHFSIPAFDAGARPLSELGARVRSTKLAVPRDSILLSKLNPRIPRIWLTDVNEARRAVCSTEFLVCVPRRPVDSAYLFGYLSSRLFREEFASLVTGTSGSHQRVQPTHFLAMAAPVTSSGDISAYREVARPLLDRMLHNIRESETLAELRDTLLPKLISGELRIRDGERAVEQAT